MEPGINEGEPISTDTPLIPRSTELLPRVIVPVEVFVFWTVKVPPVDWTNVPEAIDRDEPEVIKDNDPVAVTLLLMVMPAVALSVKLTVAPVEIPLPVKAVESTRVTLPVVLKVRLGVAMFSGPIAPLPLVKAADVEPVTVPVV